MKNELLLAGLTALVLSACSDAPQPPLAANAGPAGAEAARAARPRRAVTPAEFHAKNHMDWVGVAHNAAMDKLRAEIRRSKPKDLCQVIERISEGAAATPRFDRVAEADRHAASKEATGQIGCQAGGNHGHNAAVSGRAPRPFARHASLSSGGYEVSPGAWAVADQIQAAGVGAASAGQLASELDAVLAGAQGLSADDQAVLGALASVSLASFEYWHANGDAMAQEMADAYGPCIAAGRGDSCYFATSRPSPGPVGPGVTFASRTMPMACTVDAGVIWSADKWGAGVGLTIGLRTATVQGAIGGVLIGATALSGGGAVYEFGRYLFCAFK